MALSARTASSQRAMSADDRAQHAGIAQVVARASAHRRRSIRRCARHSHRAQSPGHSVPDRSGGTPAAPAPHHRRRGVPAGGAACRGGSAGCRHTAPPPRRRRTAARRPARHARCRGAPAAPRDACGAASCRTASMSGPTTTTMRSNTCSQLASRWRSMERPAIRCSVLGSADFMRVPRPAARITAVRGIVCPCVALCRPCGGSGYAVSKPAAILLVQFAFRSATP